MNVQSVNLVREIRHGTELYSRVAYAPDVILAVLQISLGKVERPGADVDVGIQLGEAAHVPLQLLPLVAVETDAHLADGEEGGARRSRGGGG